MESRKDLKIGVIGYGMRGVLADFAHKPEQGSTLVACADNTPKALEKFKEKYGENAFLTADYIQLLAKKDIDAVIILSPDHCHEEQTIAALNAGKHVYLEKPMAITIEGCDHILKAAYASKCKLYLGHNMRHMSFILKMKELIDSGAIGEVKSAWCRHFIAYGGDAYFKDWHAEKSKVNSLLLQKGAHDIDILHWLCNSYSREVTAFGALSLYDQITDRHSPFEYGDATTSLENWPPHSLKGLNPIIDVEDLNMILMRMDSGVLASYQQCHYTPDAWRNYCIIGTEGRIENFGDEPGNCIIKLWNKRTIYKPDGDEQFVIPKEEGSHGGADPKIISEFIRYVCNGGEIKTSPIAARNSVAAGCIATESVRNNGLTMKVPHLPKNIQAYWDESTTLQKKQLA